MPTRAEVWQNAASLLANGDVLPALRLYDAVVHSAPLDYRARMKVGDCLAALGQKQQAAAVYRAVGFYALKAGHPLTALVAARVSESLGGESEDVLAALVAFYGSESELTGRFAARVGLPRDDTAITQPGDQGDAIAAAVTRAIQAASDFDQFPAVVHPIPLLSEMSEGAFRRVLATLVVRRLPAGEAVIREGEPGQSFYFLADGAVSVFDTETTGRTRELAELGPGAIFGEMALLSARPRSASVTTTAETDLLEATRDSLAALADELPAVASALHKFTYERMLQNTMARSALFRPFNKNQQRELLRRFTSHDVAPGTAIINEGDPGTGLFVVLSGEVEVEKTDGEGRTQSLATLRPGDVFGEMSLLSAGPTTASVIAAQQSTVLFLARDYVDRMVANIPAIRDYLAALAEDRALDTQLQLGEMGATDAELGETEDDGSVVILF